MPALSNNIRLAKLLGVLFWLFSIGNAVGQEFYLPVSALSKSRMERVGLFRQKGVHGGYSPVLAKNADVSRVPGIGPDSTKYYYKITQRILSTHMVNVKTPKFKFYGDFIFDFSYAQETVNTYSEKKSLYANTRGFSIGGQIGERVYFYTDFRENQSRLGAYLDVFVDSTGVIPGSGRVKEFKGDAYDFSMANGYIGVHAAKWLDLHFGHYKQFVGHGHRSLLLSDNAFNYPYFSYALNFGDGRFNYRYSIASLQNLERLPTGDTPESIFKRKTLTTNYISYKPVADFEIGLFQGAIFKTYDDSLGTLGFAWEALNPVPIIQPAINGFNEPDVKIVVGLNAAWRPENWLKFYGQYMLDDPKNKAMGYQLGMRLHGLYKAFDLGVEFNKVSPDAYAAENHLQSFTHYNQPLAHTMGAGFNEWIYTLSYFKNRWFIQYKGVLANFESTGRDPLKDLPADIHYTNQTVYNQDLCLAYIINPTQNLQVYTGYQDRSLKDQRENERNGFWYLGMRTQLANIYRDF